METEVKPKKRRARKKHEAFRKTFEMDDARLCEASHTWRALFEKHLPDFEDFDSDLNAGFAHAWASKIKAFESHETDETVVDGQEGATTAVNKNTGKLLALMEGIEYFVKKAFPNDGRILMEFGFEKMRKPTATARLVINGFTLLLVAQYYQADLLTAEMPATLPVDFSAAIDALAQSEVAQEYEKRVRIRQTTVRIKMFNELFGIHLQVKKAAHIIYASFPERAAQFD